MGKPGPDSTGRPRRRSSLVLQKVIDAFMAAKEKNGVFEAELGWP